MKYIDDLHCQMEEICGFCRPPEKDRKLYTTEHFYVMVSLGPIVEGYLQIIRKEQIGACLYLADGRFNDNNGKIMAKHQMAYYDRRS